MSTKFNPFTGKLDIVNSPSGNDKEVQFNDEGEFAGDSGLKYDKTKKTLEIAGGTTEPVLKLKDGETDVLDVKLGSYSTILDIKTAEPTNLAVNGNFDTDLSGWGPPSTIVAEDGNVYTSVKVGEQYWMKENMRYLPEVFPSSDGSTTQSRYYVYGYQGTDVNQAKAYTISGVNIYETEGVLYNWYGAMQGSTTEGAQGICPTGWHIPTDAEQNTLDQYLKDSGQTCNASRSGTYECNTAGTKLKVGGTSGFNGILSGSRGTDSTFAHRGAYTHFWSSSASGESALRRSLSSGSAGMNRNFSSNAYGFSVRAISNWSRDVTRDTSIKYSGLASLKIATQGAVSQALNVGDTQSYTISAYVYTGSEVTSNDIELYYNSTVTTTFTSVGSGWYLLTATVIGANETRDWGVQVKANKTVYVDSFSITAGRGANSKLSIVNSGTGFATMELESTGTFNSGDIESPAIVAKGSVGQTANLQEWQDSSGNVLSSLDKTGEITTPTAHFGGDANYTHFEADGTMEAVGDATCYRDELNDLIKGATNNPASKLVIDYDEGTLIYKNNATLAEWALMNIQLNHDWELGSDIEPHIHWFQASSVTPNWLIHYRWQRQINDKTTAWTPVKWDHNAVTYVSGTINQITSFGPITPPTGYGQVSDIVQIKLFRDTNNDSGLFTGTETVGDMSAVSLDCHIRVNSLGSRSLYAK